MKNSIPLILAVLLGIAAVFAVSRISHMWLVAILLNSVGLE